MSLSSAISIAQQAFSNTAQQTAIVSKNIANAGNADYSRRLALLGSTPNGAQVVSIYRAQNEALLKQSIASIGEASGQARLRDGLELLKSALGGNDYETAPSKLLSDFRNSLQTFAATPGNKTIAATAVSDAQDLADSLNKTSTTVQDLRKDADKEIAIEVDKLNSLLADFEKANNVKVVVVPGTSSDILAKATAAKDKPQMHVMFLDDGVMVRAIGMGLCQKTESAPVMADLYPAARIKDDMALGVTVTVTGLAYNTKMFEEEGWAAPTSWMDLADKKFEGKVVFQSLSSSTYGLHGFLMFNRIQGGNESNVEPGFSKFRDTIGKNVIEFIPSSAKISEMAQTGEAAIFPLTPTAIATLKEKGIGVEYAQPKEGSVVLMVAQCVIANNSEPELSQKLAAYLLSAQAQSKALAAGNIVPSNPKAKASTPEAEKKLEAFHANMKTAITLDWDAINAKRPEWNSRWNKMIER